MAGESCLRCFSEVPLCVRALEVHEPLILDKCVSAFYSIFLISDNNFIVIVIMAKCYAVHDCIGADG